MIGYFAFSFVFAAINGGTLYREFCSSAAHLLRLLSFSKYRFQISALFK